MIKVRSVHLSREICVKSDKQNPQAVLTHIAQTFKKYFSSSLLYCDLLGKITYTLCHSLFFVQVFLNPNVSYQ